MYELNIGIRSKSLPDTSLKTTNTLAYYSHLWRKKCCENDSRFVIVCLSFVYAGIMIKSATDGKPVKPAL